MGRMPRIQVENAVYYITAGGDNNQPIFKVIDDSATYLELLAKYKIQHPFKLYAYCLVPGTISLLIEPTADVTISSIMHDLNSKYTKFFNRKYGKSGHLFQERFRMALIEKASKLLEMTAYINLMPKLQRFPYDINTYTYSSYMAYIKDGGVVNGPDISQEVKEVLAYLKGNTYQEIVAQIAINKLSELDMELANKSIIGSETFVKEVKSMMKIGKNKISEPPIPLAEPEPEPIVEPEPEPEPQPEPELEQLLGPKAEPLLQPRIEPVPDTTVKIERVPEQLLRPEPVPDTKPVPTSKSNMVKNVITSVLVIIIISGAFIFSFIKTARMKDYLNKELVRKDTETKNRLDKERKSLYKTLTDRYEAEKTAYSEAAQRLESEKENYKEAAERFEAEKNSYQEMASRLSDEKASYQREAERLAEEKKRIEEELTSVRKAPAEPVKE